MPKSALQWYIAQRSTCIKSNNPTNTRLILLLSNKGKCTQLGSLFFRLFKILSSRNQAQVCPLLCKLGILNVEEKNPLYISKLSIYAKILPLSHLSWVVLQLKKNTTTHDEKFLVWNKLLMAWSPRRESWSTIIPYTSNRIWLITNGYKNVP